MGKESECNEEWEGTERRVWIKARCRGTCDTHVIQCGLSKSHRAILPLSTYMFLLCMCTLTLTVLWCTTQAHVHVCWFHFLIPHPWLTSKMPNLHSLSPRHRLHSMLLNNKKSRNEWISFQWRSFFFLLMDFYRVEGRGNSWHPVIILTQICQQRSNLVLFSFSKTNLDFRGRYALLSAGSSLHTAFQC